MSEKNKQKTDEKRTIEKKQPIKLVAKKELLQETMVTEKKQPLVEKKKPVEKSSTEKKQTTPKKTTDNLKNEKRSITPKKSVEKSKIEKKEIPKDEKESIEKPKTPEKTKIVLGKRKIVNDTTLKTENSPEKTSNETVEKTEEKKQSKKRKKSEPVVDLEVHVLSKEDQMNQVIVIGVDEVGRGCSAGPITVCAFWNGWNTKTGPGGVRDSKKVKGGTLEKKVEERKRISDYFHQLQAKKSLLFHLVSYTAQEIDEMGGVEKANLKAMDLAVAQLQCGILKRHPEILDKPHTWKILLDGNKIPPGLKEIQQTTESKKESEKDSDPENEHYDISSIEKGDTKVYEIAAASIIAKNYRDQWMIQVADKQFPNYLFAQHKGYTTALHTQKLKELGPCSIHRVSFKNVRKTIQDRDDEVMAPRNEKGEKIVTHLHGFHIEDDLEAESVESHFQETLPDLEEDEPMALEENTKSQDSQKMEMEIESIVLLKTPNPEKNVSKRVEVSPQPKESMMMESNGSERKKDKTTHSLESSIQLQLYDKLQKDKLDYRLEYLEEEKDFLKSVNEFYQNIKEQHPNEKKGPNWCIVQCVSADFHMNAGIALTWKQNWGDFKSELLKQNVSVGM